MPFAGRHAATAEDCGRLGRRTRQPFPGFRGPHHGYGAIRHLLREMRIEGHELPNGRNPVYGGNGVNGFHSESAKSVPKTVRAVSANERSI